MKKGIVALILGLWMVSLMAGCGGEGKNTDKISGGSTVDAKPSGYDAVTDADNDSYATEAESSDTSDDELSEWVFWGAVDITYKGWAGLGSVDQIIANDNTSENDKYLRLMNQFLSFAPAENYTNLKDGDTVIITVSFDENELRKEGLKISDTSMEFRVSGIPTIIQASAYHDGVSWVEVKTGVEKNWSLLDMNGNILFQLDPGSYPVTHYENGVCIIDYERIVDKSGNTVWSKEQDGYSYAASTWGLENVKEITIYNDWSSIVSPSEILYDLERNYYGYTQVEFQIDTFEYTGAYTGFLDAYGNWYVEPTTLKASVLDQEYGIYFVSKIDPESFWGKTDGYYNLRTNELLWSNELDQDEYSQQVEKWKLENNASLHNDLLYDGFKDSFCDISGQIVIDLSNYRLASWPKPAFTDGYCMLKIENDQGAYYYTILDTNGKEMFTPRKRIEVSDCCSEGLYWEKTAENTIVYYTVDGNQAFSCEIPLVSGTEFHEGRALVKGADDIYYVIDPAGNILY